MLAAGVLACVPAVAAEPTVAVCLAASDASLDLDNAHKLRAEHAKLLVCAATTCPTEVRKECVRRAEEVIAQIPSIVVAAKDASGADLTTVKVTMDGEVLTQRLDGTPLPVDPGAHTFSFEAAGFPPVTRSLVVQQAAKSRHEEVVFGSSRPPPPPAPAPQPEIAPFGTQRTVALVAGGIGVAGIGLGAVFGIVALSEKTSAQNVCKTDPCPTQDGASKWSSAASSGNVSTAGLIVGAVGIAGAAVLWLTAPSRPRGTSTQVGVGPGSLQLRGTW